ncbi:MAG: serine/threonine protein kinase, partial [Planctomycetaceae bacterium]|nr:serine/threonine protein kinase [Planctomycetaceae bacterium]
MGRLAHYEVLEEVGSGGMGIVLKAIDTSLRRVVAIKVMAPHLAANAAARRRFVREAQAAAAVAHEHVVAIHAVADQHEPPYLAMQFIEGKTLQERLDKVGPLSVREVLRIGMQTAAGLAAAHAQGLVHRDIKPANILLENGVERVKLTDFGLARAVDDASVTQSGVIAGTPLFMSPEQARGEAVDHRSDLFSLGSVMYAMCVGHAPFRGSTTMGVLKRVCEESPRPIREVNPDVPDWLSEIIAKLLAKAPADRFQTAAEVADLLEQCLAHMQKPSDVSLPVEVRTSKSRPPTTAADTDDEPVSEAQSSSVGAFVIAFFVGLVPLFAAGQVSAYPELTPAGLSSRAFAALLRIAAVACWCVIPAIHWWRESRRPKPSDVGKSSSGLIETATTPTRFGLAAESWVTAPFVFAPSLALWLAAFLFLPIAGWSLLDRQFSAHDRRITTGIAIFVWLGVVVVGSFLNGLRRRAVAAGIPLADLAPGWRIRCTKCNRSKPLGEVGGIRMGAASRGKWTLAWCSQCRGLRWAAIERVTATSKVSPTAADHSSLEKPAVKRRWGVALFGLAMAVLCGVLLFPFAERKFDGRTAQLKLELAGAHVEVTLNGQKIAVPASGQVDLQLATGEYVITTIKNGQPVVRSGEVLHGGQRKSMTERQADAIQISGPMVMAYGPGSSAPNVADYIAIQGRWTIVSQEQDGELVTASQRGRWIEFDRGYMRSDVPDTPRYQA